jgi:uncharacterized protein YdbL (DUF1318 family)
MKRSSYLALAALAFAGCLSVKTEHEVKPIEINMNINLKLDKQLEEMVAAEEKPSVRTLLDRGAVGIDNKAMLVPRGALTSAEFEHVTEANAKFKERLTTMATENGSPYDEVAAAAAAKFVERLPAGKGIWYQTPAGEWVQK